MAGSLSVQSDMLVSEDKLVAHVRQMIDGLRPSEELELRVRKVGKEFRLLLMTEPIADPPAGGETRLPTGTDPATLPAGLPSAGKQTGISSPTSDPPGPYQPPLLPPEDDPIPGPVVTQEALADHFVVLGVDLNPGKVSILAVAPILLDGERSKIFRKGSISLDKTGVELFEEILRVVVRGPLEMQAERHPSQATPRMKITGPNLRKALDPKVLELIERRPGRNAASM